MMAGACAALVVALNQQTCDPTRTLDFASFYTAGKIVLQGQSSRLYDLSLQKAIQRDIIAGGPFMAYYHPPFQALLFVPFATFSYSRAFLLWAALNLLVLGLIVHLLRFTGCQVGTGAYLIWIGICLFFALAALAVGQDTLLPALVFLLAFLALRRRRDYAAGLALGVGLFRFEILLPFAFVFLLRRRWKVMTGFCTMSVVALAVSAALVGWAGLAGYVRTLIEVGGAATGSWADRSSAPMMPSLRGAFETLLGGVIPHRFLFPAVVAATILLLGWAAREFRDIDRPGTPAFDLEFSLATIAALLGGYHIFLGELTPLIVAGLLILGYESVRPREGILGNRRGTALLLALFGVVAALAVVHSQEFSVLVVVLLGMMVWLKLEVSTLGRPGPACQRGAPDTGRP